MKKHIALLCAAGIGQRMKSNVPKQYLKLIYQKLEQTIIEITTKKFLENDSIDAVIVALNQQDVYFQHLDSNWFDGEQSLQFQYQNCNKTLYPTINPKLFYCFGFGLRFHTVYSLLTNALDLAQSFSWDLNEVTVHIHDVARPGILQSEINYLIAESNQIKIFNNKDTIDNLDLNNEVFGILPINRVVDTVRTIESHNNKIKVNSTVDRNKIALALTPQTVNLLYYTFLMHNILVLGEDTEYINAKNLKIFPSIKKYLPHYQHIDYFIKNQLKLINIGYNKNVLISDKCKHILSSLTDDIALILYLNLKINAIEFGRNNLKITSPEDLHLAQYYLSLE